MECSHPRSDIKLENLVLTQDSTLKLVDFGAAFDFAPAQSEVHLGHIVGTHAYLAPECWNGLYSPATDLWAVGVLTCYLLFTESPSEQPKNSSSPAITKLHQTLAQLYFIIPDR